jgi:hypothetical protein
MAPTGLQPFPMNSQPDLSAIFHRLNNQLGVILANAELLEARASDDTNRARASQVVTGVLEAMGAVRELRAAIEDAAERRGRG